MGSHVCKSGLNLTILFRAQSVVGSWSPLLIYRNSVTHQYLPFHREDEWSRGGDLDEEVKQQRHSRQVLSSQYSIAR